MVTIRRVWNYFSCFRRTPDAKITCFEEWCADLPPVTDTLTAADADRIKSKLQDAGDAAVVSIDDLHGGSLSILSNARAKLGTIHLGMRNEVPVKLSNITLQKLIIPYTTSIDFAQCRIGTLALPAGASVCRFDNTFVGSLDVGNSLGRLDWVGGYLGEVKSPTGINPFSADVSLSKLRLAPLRASLRDTQNLRNVRGFLMDRGNVLAAGQFHAAELRASRHRERWPNRIASFIYDVGSDYGNSIGRPATWLAVCFVLIACFAWVGGTTPNIDSIAVGWHRQICGDDVTAQAGRAGLYAIQSIFNPLNLLLQKPLVISNTGSTAAVSAITGLFGTLAFALLVLSIRRRFKLE